MPIGSSGWLALRPRSERLGERFDEWFQAIEGLFARVMVIAGVLPWNDVGHRPGRHRRRSFRKQVTHGYVP